MSIRNRAFFRFFFLGMTFLIVLLILFLVIEDSKSVNERTKWASLQLIALEKINTAVINQTGSLANYLLNVGTAEDVAAYTSIMQDNVSVWNTLLELEAGFESPFFEEREEQEKAFYFEMQASSIAFKNRITTIIDLKERGQTSEAIELFAQSISPEGIFGKFSHTYLEEMVRGEQKEVSDVYYRTTERHNRLMLVSIMIVLLAGIQLISVFLSIEHIMIQPLKKLEMAAKSYQPGDRNIPLEMDRDDEIGSLDHAVIQMMKRINADTVQLDFVSSRVEEILQVVGQITQGNFDVSCSVSKEWDAFDRLSTGINMMIEDLLQFIKEIQVQHDWLDNILSNIKDGIITVDRQSRITYMNTIAEELTGYPRAHAMEKEIAAILPLHTPKQRKPVKLPVQELFEETRTQEPEDYCMMTSEKKEEIPIQIKWDIIKDSHHEILGALFVFQDMTSLLKKNKELEKLHMQMVEKDKLSSLGLLAAGIAHEINNPIGYIQSNLRTLRRYIDKLGEGINVLQSSLQEGEQNLKLDFLLKDMESILDDNDDGIAKISSIVEGMRSSSRAKDNRLIDYNLNHIIKETLAITESETKYIAETELNLKDVPPIRCIPNQINQVLLNLILNAAHSIEDKAALMNSDFHGTIRITTYEEEPFVVCKISDNGKGLDKEILPNIFDPFFTTKEPGKGSGLGLNISYNIIKRHQGELLVENNTEGGADFFIKLRKDEFLQPRLEE